MADMGLKWRNQCHHSDTNAFRRILHIVALAHATTPDPVRLIDSHAHSGMRVNPSVNACNLRLILPESSDRLNA
jgi:hypothetical protein